MHQRNVSLLASVLCNRSWEAMLLYSAVIFTWRNGNSKCTLTVLSEREEASLGTRNLVMKFSLSMQLFYCSHYYLKIILWIRRASIPVRINQNKPSGVQHTYVLYWTNFWQLTVHIQQKKIEKKLLPFQATDQMKIGCWNALRGCAQCNERFSNGCKKPWRKSFEWINIFPRFGHETA